MNKTQVAAMLTVASGFDRRVVDEVTVQSWHAVREIQLMSFEDGRDAVIAHQTSERQKEYLTVGLIVDAVSKMSRIPDVEADVRSAKARGLIEKTWPRDALLPADIAEKLARIRTGETSREVIAELDSSVNDYGLDLKGDAS